MRGTMLWFNADKGYGVIRTEHDERLRVAGSAFLPDQQPEPRCRGQQVSFERQVTKDDVRAVAVSFVERGEPRRARLRHGRGGHAL